MSNKRHHADWLSLVEVSGPFVSTPVMDRVFPQGLDAHDPEHSASLRLAHEEWDDDQSGQRPSTAIHNAWIKFILTETLGFTDEVLAEGQAVPAAIKATIAEHNETLRPDYVVRNPSGVSDEGKTRLLIQTYPLDQPLDKPIAGRHWKASPATRMMELLHATDVRLGLVTNGQQWMLVDAPRGGTTGFASWYAWLWFEQSDKGFSYFRSFRSLLCARRFFGVADDETLEAILAESLTHQQEVTVQLGLQVRRAVEVLIQTLDRADQDDKVLAGVPETVLYEAALTVMMRLVFLFSAEERGLLLLGDPLYDEHYAVSTLVAQLQEAADQHGEEVLERRNDAWVRLLATFRAVFGGVQHERMKLLAYAGNLFDPDRFPFLEGRKTGTSWTNTPATPLPVNNRTVLHLLRSLQYLEFRGEARRLSFIALDIEQIGHVYEGLLDHTAKRATEPMLGLLGAKGLEPEVPLSELERQRAKSEDDLVAYVAEESGRSEKAVRNTLNAELDKDQVAKLLTACGHDDALFRRVHSFGGLIRNDTFDHPVVIRKGSVFVTAGTDRRASGTHYTPRSLTEPIVQYTLEPLIYVGPAEGKPREEWKLESPKELLGLKICDMACGSGAFLVQACRYLSERLVEAWEDAEKQHPGVPGITPDGMASTGAPGETLIPKEMDERVIYAQRLIAQRCLYGVDKNPLAVEMAKLSLWLLTLAKNKPFTFLDHAIRPGDSLIGIRNIDQIRYFHLDPGNATHGVFTGPVLDLLQEAATLRKKLEIMPADTADDVETKERTLAEADEKTARLGLAADFLVSVEFQAASSSDEKETLHNSMAIQAGHYVKQASLDEFRIAAEKALCGQTPFHWPIEFPEVFANGGFDAFIGNPPFMHGSWISSHFGDEYAQYIRLQSPEVRGKVDFVIFFLHRAATLVRERSSFGLILTAKANQGDARKSGFQTLLKKGYSIYQASSDIPWPGDAGVQICTSHIYRGEWNGQKLSSYLVQDRSEEHPYSLQTNDGRVYLGAKPDSLGFVLPVEDARRLLERPKNREVLRPYYSCSDLNELPRLIPPRYIIDFSELSHDDAKAYDDLFPHVEEFVKPKRSTLKRKSYSERWWQFTEPQLALFRAIRKKPFTIAVGRVSKYFTFRLVPTQSVYSDKVVVWVSDSMTDFAILSSSFHSEWALEWGTTHGGGTPNYKPTECARTFPFPVLTEGSDQFESLRGTAERLMNYRDSLFVERSLGPTDLYNCVHDCKERDGDIQKLREIHVELDQSVAIAYGWQDVDLNHDFHGTKHGVRFTVGDLARRQVLGRLLKLNHTLYKAEGTDGRRTKAKHKTASTTRKKRKGDNATQPELF